MSDYPRMIVEPAAAAAQAAAQYGTAPAAAPAAPVAPVAPVPSEVVLPNTEFMQQLGRCIYVKEREAKACDEALKYAQERKWNTGYWREQIARSNRDLHFYQELRDKVRNGQTLSAVDYIPNF